MTRDTVGKISLDLAGKQPDTVDPIEQMREQLSEWDKNVQECVAAHKKAFARDFYVVVLTKRERLMQNVFRGYFLARLTCPTPDWDQVVYRYDYKGEYIEFLWVVPDKDSCKLMTDRALEIPDEQRELLQFVLNFSDGTLLRIAKKLNGERDKSPFLEA
jgi:hypothetical protein